MITLQSMRQSRLMLPLLLSACSGQGVSIANPHKDGDGGLSDASHAAPIDSGPTDADATPTIPEGALVITLDRLEKRPATGFLYFAADPPKALIDPLRPTFWRTTVYSSSAALALFTSYSPRVTYVLSDAWMGAHPPPARPWDDWSTYETFVGTVFTAAKDAGVAIHYWDVWNEPESTFGGTGAQLEEVIAHTASKLRGMDPAAKIAAPSIAGLNLQTLNVVLDSVQRMAQSGTHLDAFTWHAFDAPEELPAFATEVRSYFQSRPAICNPTCPELHVNEFSAGQNDHVPGWALAWLTALDSAKVDFASKACWQIPQPTGNALSGCSKGFAGLFSTDGQTPRPTYWVYRAHAELDERVVVTTNRPGWVGTAGRCSDGEVRVLLGRYSCGKTNKWCSFADHNVDDEPADAPASVVVALRGLPLSPGEISITRIPRRLAGAALDAPEPVSTASVVLSRGVAIVPIDDLGDGDVLVATWRPR